MLSASIREPIKVNEFELSAAQIKSILTPHITLERQAGIRTVVSERCGSVMPVLEGLYDRGNMSAVLRSAEGLGYQEVHLIESSQKFKKANRVTQGAEKWLDVVRWNSTAEYISQIKQSGYRVIVTHMDDARPINEVSFSTPAVIVLGNEKEGISQEMLEAADESVMIPMAGFAQSFNISVAAALALYQIQQSRIHETGTHADLSEREQECLTASYYLRHVNQAEKIVQRMVESMEDLRKERT
jgi:tRNA (guanosine-2'-O-)-methyltransferase